MTPIKAVNHLTTDREYFNPLLITLTFPGDVTELEMDLGSFSMTSACGKRNHYIDAVSIAMHDYCKKSKTTSAVVYLSHDRNDVELYHEQCNFELTMEDLLFDGVTPELYLVSEVVPTSMWLEYLSPARDSFIRTMLVILDNN